MAMVREAPAVAKVAEVMVAMAAEEVVTGLAVAARAQVVKEAPAASKEAEPWEATSPQTASSPPAALPS